jgi:prevent-host-death family protein
MVQSARVGIREAKVHLSRYLRMVRKGAEIIITDRGKPVGKIVPMEAVELSLADRIKRLEDQGVIVRQQGNSEGQIPAAIPLADSTAQKILQQDRSNA